MRESAQLAHSYVRSKAVELAIDPDVFERTDIHLHVPASAIPKDGPSAGVAMVVAIASVLSERPACHNIGMTGEMTLRGRVLPVAGVKMKVLAAHRAGLKTVIVPKWNAHDLDEVPEDVRQSLTFITVEMILTTCCMRLYAGGQEPHACSEHELNWWRVVRGAETPQREPSLSAAHRN